MRSLLFEFLLCVFSGICFGWEMKSNDCLLPWKFDKNCSISQLKTEPTCQPGSVSENVPHWTLDDCITPFLAPDSGANLCLDLESCLLEKVKLHTSLLPWDGSRLMIACLIHKLMCNQNSRFCMALENAGPKCILQKEKIDLCLKKGESIINLKQRHLFVLECFFGPRLDPLTENCKVPDAFIHFPLDLCFELEQRSEPLNVPAVATSTAPQTKLQWPRCYRGDDLRLDSCQKLSDWLSSCIGDADLFEKVNCKDTILSHYREIIEDHHSCTDDYIGAFHLCLHWKVYNWPLKGPVQQFCHTVEKNSCQKFSYPGQFEDLFNMNISQVAAKVWCIRNQLSGDCWSVKAAVENCMNETLLLSGLASCAEETMLPAVHRYMEILNDHENCSLDYVAAYQICLIHYLRTRSEANGISYIMFMFAVIGEGNALLKVESEYCFGVVV
ncbi:uncharacterized protein LOC122808140 [Protopterus annectens]|uniref:uncharacterized protein LOC122808140 n=1 Tax=Protopterus annectens TaxID=7888 RepID=UPI001CF987EA|nr:uncharacterized protein LOC122808140 [Protopterus annectens]